MNYGLVKLHGGYSRNFYARRLRPEVQLLTLLYTIFDRISTPFVYLLLTNGTPITYLFLEVCIPLNCIKYTVFEI